jgi:hypothetical protein
LIVCLSSQFFTVKPKWLSPVCRLSGVVILLAEIPTPCFRLCWEVLKTLRAHSSAPVKVLSAAGSTDPRRVLFTSHVDV